MKNLILLPIVAITLFGCASSNTKSEAPGPASQATGLNTAGARITDERILADRRTIDGLQQRLRNLNEAGIPQKNYSLAKAQCWLDSARTQYFENDRTGYIEESLTESAKIIRALEQDKAAKVGYDTPLVARSTRLRDDLWAQLNGFKAQDPAILACNAQAVACAEVRLVRAGHAEEQTGWRAATPHVQMAEDGVRNASQQAAQCQAAAPAVSPIAGTAAPAPVVIPTVVQTVTKETFIILADTLFQFDKSGSTDMLPGGLQRLNTVAERLKSYQSIQTLTIVGHTDRVGSDEYNDPLSLNRANTVKAYFESLGVKAAKLEAIGKGKREPVSSNCSDKLPRERLIECLQPDRRVTVEVTGVAK